jgi:uncharacterized SAM-binding protein YcdF (DUF218 family)
MLFAFSKLAWSLVSPGSLLVFLLVAGLALAAVPRPRIAKLGRRLCMAVAACLLAIAVLPVGEWALTPLENRTSFDPPEQVDGIVVIGGDEQTGITEARGAPTALDSLRRYVTFMDLARRYPDAKLVFSGGPVFARPDARIVDADVARAILIDIGVSPERMMFEKTSRNTWENAVFSAGMVRPDPAQKWLLVTSPWHMPRALGCFRKAGWAIYPAPAGYWTTGRYRLRFLFRFDDEMHMLTLAAHEYVGLVAYWLMGRTDVLWPH